MLQALTIYPEGKASVPCVTKQSFVTRLLTASFGVFEDLFLEQWQVAVVDLQDADGQ